MAIIEKKPNKTPLLNKFLLYNCQPQLYSSPEQIIPEVPLQPDQQLQHEHKSHCKNH